MRSAQSDFQSVSSSTIRSKVSHKTTRDCPRLTLRLSVEDHERLQALANGMALSTYIRMITLGDAMPRRKTRSTQSVVEKQALAQILGLLGQSRIANNINQLAYHANIGALPVDETTRAQINDGYQQVLLIRRTLMQALGMQA
ncbi:MAG: hypothetical protein ACU0AZ_13145 [Paracoccaceae bacterium]